jgi:hypothetical protein
MRTGPATSVGGVSHFDKERGGSGKSACPDVDILVVGAREEVPSDRGSGNYAGYGVALANKRPH